MKYFTSALITLALVVPLLLVSTIGAQEVDPIGQACSGNAQNSEVCTAGSNDPITGENGVLLRAVDIISYMAGFAAVLMLVIAGLKFVTSSGDPNSVKSARDTIIYALIGVAVLILCQTIVKFVISKI